MIGFGVAVSGSKAFGDTNYTKATNFTKTTQPTTIKRRRRREDASLPSVGFVIFV